MSGTSSLAREHAEEERHRDDDEGGGEVGNAAARGHSAPEAIRHEKQNNWKRKIDVKHRIKQRSSPNAIEERQTFLSGTI